MVVDANDNMRATAGGRRRPKRWWHDGSKNDLSPKRLKEKVYFWEGIFFLCHGLGL